MRLNAKKVLVTGGTGFIGGRLVEKLMLEHNAAVRVLVRNFTRAPRIARFDIQMFPGEILDGPAVETASKGCDVIFHCAYDFGGVQKDRKRSNVDGTENVARAALKNGSRVVHVSTVNVYGWPLDGILEETCPKSPGADIYSQTKFAAEQVMWRYHRQHALPLVIVQPTIVYGPFSRPWTLAVLERLKSNQAMLIDQGEGVCNAAYIDDVVDGLILGATEPRAIGEEFLLSGPDYITWKEFYAGLENLIGRKGTVSISFEEAQRLASAVPSLGRRVIRAAKESSILRSAYKKSRVFLPEKMKERVTAAIANIDGNTNGGVHSMNGKHIIEPLDRSRLDLYRTRCRVKIDKARRLLGYEPRFNFERGISVTGQFLRWAALVPTNGDAWGENMVERRPNCWEMGDAFSS